jgi:hypothetical protein
MMKSVITLAFAAACVAFVPAAHAQYVQNTLVTNGPQASRGDFGDWDARRNVIESRHYDRLLEISPGFRHARMRRECGPINDPRLRSDCLASFNQYEPMVGSTIAPRRYRTIPGAGY